MYLRFAAAMCGMFLVGTTVLTDIARANSGCCLQRDSETAPWVEISRDFTECLKMNAEKDGDDDLMIARGLIWWSPDC